MHVLLQASLRTALSGRRDVESVGPFLIAFDPDDDSPFRNYAIPDDDSDPTLAEVEDLRRAFLRRARIPRLEFLPAAAPAVVPMLLAAGFASEGRHPMMTCTAGDLRESPTPTGVDVAIVTASAALEEAARVQNAAYNAGDPTEADVVRLERTIVAGGQVALARDCDSRAIGSGLITAPGGGLAELAAIGVLPAWRRRGIAAALTRALARAAFDNATEIVMLMAAEEAEQRIYARVGFTVAAEIVFIAAAK